MVDIYEIAPRDKDPQTGSPAAHYAHAGQEARMARYQSLLTKLSSNDDLAAAAVAGRVEWDAPEEDNIELQKSTAPVKVEADSGPLVGTFAEAATAMR
jgi:hypothetical protein